MQDSFDARLQGQVPETVRPRTSKGWMICSILLFIVLIGVCAFGGIIILKGNRDTNRLADVEQELKDKDAKIAELEKEEKVTDSEITDSSASTADTISVDMAKFKTSMAADLKIDEDDLVIHSSSIMAQGEQKYIIAEISYGTSGSGAAAVYYKENKVKDSEWEKLWSGHQMLCKGLSQKQIAIMNELVTCIDDEGNSRLVGTN